MAILQSMKVHTFLFTSVVFLISCTNGCADKKLRTFDFKYETVEFLNGDILLELPDKPNSNPMYGMYYKILVDKYIDLTSGHGPISSVDVDRYNGPRDQELTNKLLVKVIKDIYPDYVSISRTAIQYGESPIILQITTITSENTFPTKSEKEARIKTDDEIFEHIIQSFKYRKEDGTYAKPEIIRQVEEVKEVKHTEAEYHGNG